MSASMLTEKQCRAICRAMGVLPDRAYPFTRVTTDEESGDVSVETVKFWRAVQRAAEEASDG